MGIGQFIAQFTHFPWCDTFLSSCLGSDGRYRGAVAAGITYHRRRREVRLTNDGGKMMPMYRVDIDQSGRVEKSGSTVVAFANDVSYAIRVPSKTSTAGLQAWEDKGVSSKLAKPLLWASCIYLLLEGHLNDLADEATKIVIDNEFDGHENRIKSTLVEYIKKHYGNFPFRKIRVGSIGKQSPAHKKASTVRAQKHLRPDRTITPREIRRLILG